MKRKKNQKRPITESAGTPWYGGFRSSDLNTAASSARLIFLRKAIVQGRSRSGAWHAIGELKKKKRRITESSVTPSYGGFRRSDLNTAAGSARLIFLRKTIVQGRSRSGEWHAIGELKKKKKANH